MSLSTNFRHFTQGPQKGLFSQHHQCNTINSRSYCTLPELNKPVRKWDLYGAICLERKPVIMKPLNETERRVLEMMTELEVEGSYKSDHEIRHEEDRKRTEEMKTEKKLLDLEVALQQTAHEFEDVSNKEFDAFKPEPKISADDKKNNVKSLNRELSNHLLLLVKEKIGKSEHWILPHGIRKDTETMRETAERVLRESFGDELNVMFLGNSPCGFYKWIYPKACKIESVGAKIFFFKALYLSGPIKVRDTVIDYQWAVRSDLKKLLTDKEYFKQVSKFLIDDEESDQTVRLVKQSTVLKEAKQEAL